MKSETLSVFSIFLLLSVFANLRAQPVPHHFTSITVGTGNTVTLGLDGSVSNMFDVPNTISNLLSQAFDLYVVDACTNMVDWARLDVGVRTNNDPNPLLMRDTNAAALNKRFYRIYTNQLPTFYPKPSGPFAVGMVDRVMIDPARTNLYRYSPPTNAFMVTFWYPADSPAVGVLPTPDMDPGFVASSVWSYWGVDPSWSVVWQKIVQHAYVGIPLASNADKFPVVLLSHGLTSFRKTFNPLVAELASHGYVVVAVDHPDCYGSAFPDGRFLMGNHSGDVLGRLNDMQFLLAKLAQMENDDPLVAGRLDLDHIGVFGHSYGGEVVEICRTNSQVKAAALYDATNVQIYSGGLQKPLLEALGQNNYFYSEDLWLFRKATNNAVFFQLAGADHNTCTDAAWSGELPWGRIPNRAFTDCLIWFFDTYLKGQSPVFPSSAAIYNLQMK